MDRIVKTRVNEVLAAVRATFMKPGSWCKGTPYTARAMDLAWCVRQCANLLLVTSAEKAVVVKAAFTLLREATGYEDLTAFNDSPRTKHADIIAALDKATDDL